MTPHAAAPCVAALDEPVHLRLGGYSARVGTRCDIKNMALRLRASVFRKGADDCDSFDDAALHGVVLSENQTVQVAFRASLLWDEADLNRCYTGQFYDLRPLHGQRGPFLELGRVCQAAGPTDVTALQMAWAALGRLVDAYKVQMMMGCSSLAGADPHLHSAALASLRANHMGPVSLAPHRKSPDAFDLPDACPDPAKVPHLLRSYLGMGGWVSDHAVQDIQLDRVHVFTGLMIDAIPEARKARLRAMAQSAGTVGPKPLDLARAAP